MIDEGKRRKGKVRKGKVRKDKEREGKTPYQLTYPIKSSHHPNLSWGCP